MTLSASTTGADPAPPTGDGPSSPPAVAGWLLRGGLALAVLAVVVLTLVGGSGTGALTVAGLVLLAAGVATVVRPDSPGAVFLLLAAMAAHLMFDSAEIDVGVALLAALIAVVHQLAGICAAIPLDARVDVSALRPAALRLVVAIVVVELGIVLVTLIG
ncbi:hypothetical protein [Nakamurella lactea]|uniref:hypothetical protein n=1 Tax=Nakamurella lactea TaxID=459515 RepID=UPI00040D0F7A|nr:hypothetical protein [Nakamurella lactea]